MKSSTANKIIALFLALTMFLTVFTMFFYQGAPEKEPSPEQQPEQESERFDPSLWQIDQPLYSISDGLHLTPPGIRSAEFIDVENIQGTSLEQWVKQDPNNPVSQIDELFQSNSTKLYFADVNGTPLVLDIISPRKIAFEYIELPNRYKGYSLLESDRGIQIMGDPIIFTRSVKIANGAIDAMFGGPNAYQEVSALLNETENDPFQQISVNPPFARAFYMGISENDSEFQRTNVYLDAGLNVTKKLKQLEANSTKRGFTQYNITKKGNVTVVRMVSGLFEVLNEEYY